MKKNLIGEISFSQDDGKIAFYFFEFKNRCEQFYFTINTLERLPY